MFRVTNDPIDLAELVRYVGDPEAGAIVPFIGTTRNNNEGRKVIALDYEAYPEMAEKELARIGADAAKRWPICRMAIVHRLGSGADRRGQRDHRGVIGAPGRGVCRQPVCYRGNQKNRADLEKGSLRGGRGVDRHADRPAIDGSLTLILRPRALDA